MTNKQARSSCKPHILPCIHASTLDVLTNSFSKLDHHPVAEIQSRRMAYSCIHATSSSASSLTSPTHRGLDDATTWRLHSEPHPHGSSTPIQIKHNRDLHGSKSACMQANKEEVCVHVRAGQQQIAAALACAHAHMASSIYGNNFLTAVTSTCENMEANREQSTPPLYNVTHAHIGPPSHQTSRSYRKRARPRHNDDRREERRRDNRDRRHDDRPESFKLDQITPYTADQTFCLNLSHALIFF